MKSNFSKTAIKEAYSDGYKAGISNANCICKSRLPIEDHTVIRKECLKYLLEKASEPGNIDDLFKEKKDEVSKPKKEK